jgi:hypothetical protein
LGTFNTQSSTVTRAMLQPFRHHSEPCNKYMDGAAGRQHRLRCNRVRYPYTRQQLDHIPRHCLYQPGCEPLAAGWQSGYAADCKSAYSGSIPLPASTKFPLFFNVIELPTFGLAAPSGLSSSLS